MFATGRNNMIPKKADYQDAQNYTDSAQRLTAFNTLPFDQHIIRNISSIIFYPIFFPRKDNFVMNIDENNFSFTWTIAMTESDHINLRSET
jgi:hypothetical protein